VRPCEARDDRFRPAAALGSAPGGADSYSCGSRPRACD